MPAYPKGQRGKNESPNHYFQRLDEAKKNAVKYQSSATQADYGDLIARYQEHYKFFLSASFKYKPSLAKSYSLANSFVQRTLDFTPVAFGFYSIEDGIDRRNVHMLIGRIAERPVWPFGYFDCEEFDPTLGASYYVTKSTSRDFVFFGGWPKEKPPNADRWWRPGWTLNKTNIVGLTDLRIVTS